MYEYFDIFFTRHLYVHTHICIYINMLAWTSGYLYVSIHLYTKDIYIYIHKYACMNILISLHLNTWRAHAHTHTCTHTHTHTYYINIYMYTHTHVHIFIYIYIYTQHCTLSFAKHVLYTWIWALLQQVLMHAHIYISYINI